MSTNDQGNNKPTLKRLGSASRKGNTSISSIRASSAFAGALSTTGFLPYEETCNIGTDYSVNLFFNIQLCRA